MHHESYITNSWNNSWKRIVKGRGGRVKQSPSNRLLYRCKRIRADRSLSLRQVAVIKGTTVRRVGAVESVERK